MKVTRILSFTFQKDSELTYGKRKTGAKWVVPQAIARRLNEKYTPEESIAQFVNSDGTPNYGAFLRAVSAVVNEPKKT